MTNDDKNMTKLIKHITAWCLIVGLYALFTINDSFAGGCCAVCSYSGISLTLTDNTGCAATTYDFAQTGAMSADAVVTADGVKECTIDFPAGTNALTATTAGSTCDGTAIAAFTTQTATQLIFIVPSTILDDTPFNIVIANVTNGDGLSANCTVTMDNDAGCINQGTTYAFTTTACPTCVDGILNQDEVCIDCGGVCGACGTCTELSAGDIAIVGFNTTDPDEFTFVLLTDVVAGTTINFTDRGWKSDNTFYPTSTGEGVVIWTAPGGGLTCGTEIMITPPSTASLGTAADGAGTFSLAMAGDQILAYQGPEDNPIFIFGLNDYDAGGAWQADATTAQESAIPTGLTDGTNAIGITPDLDNGKYDCSTTTGTAAELLTAICSNANWSTSDTRFDLTVYCTFTCGASATCADGIQNGTETGVDCGGSCPDICHCINGIRDGDETGIDCGGADCPACSACP
ncbi:hypothetical protein JYU16_02095 [bacterium AH-315-M05]|nr:hypothetical protein [bacterium AH-315-M05]